MIIRKEMAGFLLLLLFAAAPAGAQQAPPLLTKGYAQFDFGLGLVQNPDNAIRQSGAQVALGFSTISRSKLVVGACFRYSEFTDTHPEIKGSGFFASTKPAEHEIRAFSLQLGKALPLSEELLLLLTGGPAYATLREPENVQVVPYSIIFFGQGEGYSYTIRKSRAPGFTATSSLQWHLSPQAGIGAGLYYHLSLDKRLQHGGISFQLLLGKLR